MNKQTLKEVFTILGSVQASEGRKKFVPKSLAYFNDRMSRIKEGQVLHVTFSTSIPTRSQSQLDYHWVLMQYIADSTGYTKEEVHEWMMVKKFGTSQVTLNGESYEVRKSVANRARFPKSDMVELITADLELCRDLGINVPTPEELGYISNRGGYGQPLTPVRHE